MRTLIVDTSLGACTALVCDGATILAAQTALIGIGHAERLPAMVAEVLRQSHARPIDVACVAATIGPGSFMGVRVGLSFAKGFGLAHGAQTRGITTFAALAATAGADPSQDAVAIDARREQVYLHLPGDEPCVLDVGDAKSRMTAQRITRVIGSGGEVLSGPWQVVPTPVATPVGLAAAAASGEFSPLAPLYLRAPDAKPPKSAT